MEILSQLASLLGESKIKAITVSLIMMGIFVLPVWRKKVSSRLDLKRRATFDSIASDIIFQIWILFGGVVAYSIAALFRVDVSFVSGDALPFVCVLGPLLAAWNIWRAEKLTDSAYVGANKARIKALDEIKQMNQKAFGAGIIALAYGGVALCFILAEPVAVPPWLWFVSFLVTGFAVASLSWSISTFAVASEFARNDTLGRATPRRKKE